MKPQDLNINLTASDNEAVMCIIRTITKLTIELRI